MQGNDKMGVNLLVVQSVWGIGKMRPWKVLPHAQTCLRRNSDTLVRCPNPRRARTQLFVAVGHVARSDGTAAHEGGKVIPLFNLVLEEG